MTGGFSVSVHVIPKLKMDFEFAYDIYLGDRYPACVELPER